MTEKKKESTGIDRKYEPPSKGKFLALIMVPLFTGLYVSAQSKIQMYSVRVLGLDPFLVALYIGIFTIVDIVNDPIVARYSDKSTRFTRKYGKRFPFILISQILWLPFLVLQFISWPLNPEGGLADPNSALFVAIYIAFIVSVWDCIKTFQDFGKSAFINDFMRDQKSRGRFFSLRNIVVNVLGNALGLLMIPILLSVFNAFDAEGKVANPNAYFMMALVVALIMCISIPLHAYAFWEPKEMRNFRADFDEKVKNAPFLTVIKNTFTDRNWLALMVISLQGVIVIRILLNGIDYVILDVFNLNIGMTIIPQIAYILGTVAFTPVAYYLLKRVGSKKTYLYGIILSSITIPLTLFSRNIIFLSLFVFIFSIGIGLQFTSRPLYRHQALDDSILKHGTREEAQYLAVNGMVSSTSNFIQASLFAIVVTGFGFVPALGYAGNTEIAKFGLLFNLAIIPMVIMVISGLIFWKLSDITAEKAIDNKEKLLELGR